MLIGSACLLVVALPAVASARPVKRDFPTTFPHAAVLCAKADAGTLPKGLTASSAQVKAACATLTASFTAAQSTFTTAITPLRAQAKAAVTAAHTACVQARATKDPAACRTARQQARATLRNLATQAKGVTAAYHASVQSARKTFWASIHSLRGGASITPDATVGAGPSSGIPTTV